MSEIVFSIIHLVRKQNNLIYKIDKVFKKIYKIEFKKYLNCFKLISSIYYKNNNVYNNLFVLKNKKKEISLMTEKQLKPINKKKNDYNSCEGKTIDCSNINEAKKDKKRIALFILKSKSLDNNNIKDIKDMISKFNNKEIDIKNNNNNNSILYDSSTKNIVHNDKYFLKPIKLNSSRNFVNSRYHNASNSNINNSNYISSNYIEMTNKLKSLNFSSIDIKKNESMQGLNLKDCINDNSSKKLKKNFKVNSCINLFDCNSNINNISKYKNNILNSFRKNFEAKEENDIQLHENNDSSNKNEIKFYLSNKKENIPKSNNKKGLSFKKKETRNVFENINKYYGNVNDIIIKLPKIKK
jgi:hypothetical protein